MLDFLTFLALAMAFITPWLTSKKWIPLGAFGLSIILGFLAGLIKPEGLLVIAIWVSLWVGFIKSEGRAKAFFFSVILVFAFAMELHQFNGFSAIELGYKFRLGFLSPTVGLLPLIFVVPLAKSWREWKTILVKEAPLALIGAAAFCTIIFLTSAIKTKFAIPQEFALRLVVNFIFTCIAEEAFFRGFLQRWIAAFWNNSKAGHLIAILFTSLAFTLCHLFWAPSYLILGGVFVASLLYGAIYALSNKVESSILCHFTLNLLLMIFFKLI